MEEINFEKLATESLQMFSVQQFMKSLGYMLYRTDKGGLVFAGGNTFNIGKEMLSYNSAISLHNAEWDVLEDGTVTTTAPGFLYKFDAYALMQALSRKVITTAKMQYSKKRKKVIVSEDLVKFEVPIYANMFLPVLEQSMNTVQKCEGACEQCVCD